METTTIAYLGKGGSGKSITASLTARIALDQGKKVLLIDADPAMGLATALDVHGFKTIGEARSEILRQAKITKSEETARLSEIIDYLLMEALFETEKFSLLVMGRTDTVGCYCSINSLLRETLGVIAGQFDVVIIDAEAGIEQINREVTRSVTHAVVLTDNSLRGAKTAILARETIEASPGMTPKKTGVLFNRVDTPDPELVKLIEDGGLPILGVVPPDPVVTLRDSRGLSALEMPADSAALLALREILEREGIL
ncbi:MAG: hypothetical protein CVU65_13220 [Deltaproteobacteria bacterium HGW-Deltaproteobacteria-22]|jgi:CO dehydrogenase maturation factor|nr:MAG: hypothetical protein CVU65_13220 [Deltaproteobacteria bacterium HGW-Deltaproteobacteria-22]